MTGVQMIAAERARQVAKGYKPALDDERCSNGDLVRMAVAYAASAYWRERGDASAAEDEVDSWWPWHASRAFKETGDTIASLTRAGALLAAEIDRLQRLER